jgi:1,4-alpha-glucan branching enzyme
MSAWKNIDIPLDVESFNALLEGRHETPRDFLGPQQIKQDDGRSVCPCLVRAFLPDADKVWIVNPSRTVEQEMKRVTESGLFEVVCEKNVFETDAGRYKLKINQGETTKMMNDPYAYGSTLTELDLYLFNEGNHYEIYEKLGAHIREVDGVVGVNFAVWAPNAQGISLIGDFNQWDGTANPMHKLIPSGVWELFVPGLAAGEKYKFKVTDAHGQIVEKTDPYGFFSEIPPRTASIVTDLNQYQWQDSDWIAKRESEDQLSKPISVYELHPGSWQQDQDGNGWLNYRDLADRVVKYCLEFGFTHIELMPITEHPFTGSWGYQTVGYFAPTSRYGSPEDLMFLVDHCHQNGIGVIVDWVPAHFPKDGHGLAKFDGTALFEHADPRQGYHPDWDTLIFNYGRNEVRNFLISNALFWLKYYHIDGLRVDAVASMLYLDYSREDGEWVPNQFGGRENIAAIDFLKRMNEKVHEEFPGALTIAEESTAWGGVSRPTYCGGLGFSLKWNMGWMNDTLRYQSKEPVHRRYHHDELTFSLIYAFTENFMLPFSHDEVVHGKGSLLDQMPGDIWQKFANLRLLYAYMWTHPGKKLLFMGCEWGQWNEWNVEAGLQWDLLQWESHSGMQKLVGDLNRVYKQEKSLHEVDFESEGFEWVDSMSHEKSILAYLRRAKDPKDFTLTVLNFTPVVHQNYRIGVPQPGRYAEILNSDSSLYSGSNQGNGGGVVAEEIEAQGRPWSINITLPPLAGTIFKKV